MINFGVYYRNYGGDFREGADHVVVEADDMSDAIAKFDKMNSARGYYVTAVIVIDTIKRNRPRSEGESRPEAPGYGEGIMRARSV